MDLHASCIMFAANNTTQHAPTPVASPTLVHPHPLTKHEEPPGSHFARPPTPLPPFSTSSPECLFPLLKPHSSPLAPCSSRLCTAIVHLPLFPFLPINPSFPPHSARGGGWQSTHASPQVLHLRPPCPAICILALAQNGGKLLKDCPLRLCKAQRTASAPHLPPGSAGRPHRRVVVQPPQANRLRRGS